MFNKYFTRIVICFLFVFSAGCGNQPRSAVERGIQYPPPTFTEVSWPHPFSELPDGKLVISGSLDCPAGFFQEMPIAVDIYPTALINPPLIKPTGRTLPQNEFNNLLMSNPTIQMWVTSAKDEIYRRVTTGPFFDAPPPPKGNRSRALLSENFNQLNYLDFNSGNFRVDFDQTAQLTGGEKLFILSGIDQDGRCAITLNIFHSPDYAPGVMSDLDSASMAFAQRFQGLYLALTQVLNVSGENRTADIILLTPFLTFISEAYGTGYNEKSWDIAAANLRTNSTNAANEAGLINPFLRLEYYNVITYIAKRYEFLNSMSWRAHFVYTPSEGTLAEKNEEAVQEVIGRFSKSTEEYMLTDRGVGVLELTVLIFESQNLVAQFTIIGDPANPLTITGWIGSHTIVPGDYNPYFLEVFGIFEDEQILWPPVGM